MKRSILGSNPSWTIPELLVYGFSSATVFLLAVHNQYTPPFIIAWLFFWLFEFVRRKNRLHEDEKKSSLLMLFFLGMNVVFLIGLLMSDNKEEGSVLFFRRLSLLVFPVLLFSPGNYIRHEINTLLKVFVVGLLSYLLFCYGYALFRSFNVVDGIWNFSPILPEQPWLNHFYGELLSIDQHPSYIAMYCILAMFICFEFFFQKDLKSKFKLLWIIAAFFLFTSVYFLSSRASYVALLVTVPGYFLLKLRLRLKNIRVIIPGIILIGSFLFLFVNNQRVSLYFDNSNDPELFVDGRFEIWKSALKVIEKNPVLGVGIGDYYSEMDKEFKAAGFTTGYYKDFNAHNEYLEILCISGIIGFLLFLVILGYMIYLGIKDKNILCFVFIITILIFFSFESMLSRLAGNSFFALFSFLLIHYKGTEKNLLDTGLES